MTQQYSTKKHKHTSHAFLLCAIAAFSLLLASVPSTSHAFLFSGSRDTSDAACHGVLPPADADGNRDYGKAPDEKIIGDIPDPRGWNDPEYENEEGEMVPWELDTTYKDLEITVGSGASQDEDMYMGTKSPNPVFHKATRKFSPLKLSPWYNVDLQKDGKPYLGPVYRGEADEARLATRMSYPDPVTTLDTCQQVVRPQTGINDPQTPYDPVWQRMQMDSCANIAILTRARNSRVSAEVQGPYKAIAKKGEKACQPFRLIPVPDTEQEYLPSDYVAIAWEKLLFNPNKVILEGRIMDWGNFAEDLADDAGDLDDKYGKYTDVFSQVNNVASAINAVITMVGALLSQGGPTEPRYAENNGVEATQWRIPPPNVGQKYRARRAEATDDSIESEVEFGKTCVNDLVERQVERIIDPSHPFSPRWRFKRNERDYYSPLTFVYSETAAANYVRCLGDKDETIIKTDIMDWRDAYFSRNMFQRIIWNSICKYLKIVIFGIKLSCWKDILKCHKNKQNGQSNGQCCATNYDGKDKGGLFSSIVCGRPSIMKLCEYITRPLVPANPLKIRAADEANFPQGVPEGYKFSDYFGDHRPYMRCWDTGRECGFTPETEEEKKDRETAEAESGESTNNPYSNLDPMSIDGSEYAIVGVGRPGGEQCAIGGGDGQDSKVNSAKNKDVDPITSWAELKLYQARSTILFGQACLVQHEEAFKFLQGEELILSEMGGEYQVVPDNLIGEEIDGKQSFGTVTRTWPLSWRGYVSDPNIEHRFPNYQATYSFAPTAGKGLDGAENGDILLFDHDTVYKGQDDGNRRLPYLALVKDVHQALEGGGVDWIKVKAYNHGKFVDACGNTDQLGQGSEYTMYRDELPAANIADLESVGYYGAVDDLKETAPYGYDPTHYESCDDPRMSSCVERHWGDVERYFAKNDPRPAAMGGKPFPSGIPTSLPQEIWDAIKWRIEHVLWPEYEARLKRELQAAALKGASPAELQAIVDRIMREFGARVVSDLSAEAKRYLDRLIEEAKQRIRDEINDQVDDWKDKYLP